MFREVDAEFAYEAYYFDGSQYVHSGPDSVTRIGVAISRRRHFAVEPMPQSTHVVEALSVSNGAVLMALDALNDYVGLGLEPRILEIRDRWLEFARSTFKEQKP